MSPLFGEFANLGALSIFTGTRDVLNPDAHVLAQNARAAGVSVMLVEEAGQLHVYPLLPTAIGQAARGAIVLLLSNALRSR